MRHPYIWTILVPLLVSGLISLFATEIRAVLGVLTKLGFRGVNNRLIALQENKLQLIIAVHGNAYNLLVWLLLELRPVIAETILLGLAAILTKISRPNWELWRLLLSLIPGFWVGTLMRINEILKYLRDYEKAHADLNRSIAVFKAAARK